MSTAGFVLHKECVIKRPLDVVRAHYLDFAHHIAHGVHRGVEYTVLERHEGGAKQRVVSRFRVMGLLKVDEIVAFATPGGEIVQRFEKGDFAGGSIRIRFEREAPGVTHLYATFDAPLRGVNRLLSGIVKRTVEKLTEQAIEEDRLDLEGDYAPDPEILAAIAHVMSPAADVRAVS